MRSGMIRCCYGSVLAENTIVNTAAFVGILGPGDTDTQRALQTLDRFSASGSSTFQNDTVPTSGDVQIDTGDATATVILNDNTGGTLTFEAADGSGSITFTEAAGTGGITYTEAEGLLGSRDGVTYESIVLASDPSGPSDPWTLVADADWSYVAGNIDTVESLQGDIQVNTPVRFLDRSGFIANENDPGTLSGFVNMTGLVGAILERSGRLYIVVSDAGGGNFVTTLYAHADGAVGFHPVGHTAAYNAAGAKAIIADNGSGLGGTITVDVVQATEMIVEFYRWCVVRSITSSTLTLAGNTITASVEKMWWGDSTRLVQITERIKGNVGGLGMVTVNALETIENKMAHWFKTPARAMYQAFHAMSVVTMPGCSARWKTYKVISFGPIGEGNITENVTVDSGDLVVDDTPFETLNDYQRLDSDDRWEILFTRIDDGEFLGEIQNITCHLILVLE